MEMYDEPEIEAEIEAETHMPEELRKISKSLDKENGFYGAKKTEAVKGKSAGKRVFGTPLKTNNKANSKPINMFDANVFDAGLSKLKTTIRDSESHEQDRMASEIAVLREELQRESALRQGALSKLKQARESRARDALRFAKLDSLQKSLRETMKKNTLKSTERFEVMRNALMTLKEENTLLQQHSAEESSQLRAKRKEEKEQLRVCLAQLKEELERKEEQVERSENLRLWERKCFGLTLSGAVVAAGILVGALL